ncbi:VWA domain-containing protein, partial [Granulicella sp. S156]|uniref:VWA domain-containing protein n=1 Tax=Granulicella sp. S156 TaxID=1747224 RepID=UPI00131D6556
TQLVVVDVAVQDQNGHPIRGLTKDSFQLLESKTPQQVLSFEEHTSSAPQARGPELPKLPPGIFTDYTSAPPNGTLNILLLDTLNTPLKDQGFVRNQLQQYVIHAAPNARIAIFGLTNRLILLQGFSSDPEMLKDAVEHKLIPRASVLLEDPTGNDADTQSLSDITSDMGPVMAQTSANLQQFAAEQQSFPLQLRQQYTLDAFNELAHYLANFPDRKNVIWFSGGFPLNILPDPSLKDPFSVMEMNNKEFRETTNLLNRAQVAVYPVEASNPKTVPALGVANSGQKDDGNPTAVSNDVAKLSGSQATEHTTMEQLADDTGGHAYYNTNGLADAVARAMDSGSNYYTLTYNPSNSKWKGEYRKIQVNLTGTLATRGLQLAYRHGYYADDPNQTPTTAIRETAATAAHSAEAYAATAMTRGTPTPGDILFKVRVLPDSKTDEDTVAPGNELNPNERIKGPFRRFDVDFVALPGDFQLTQLPDGMHTGTIEFKAYVYDPNGKLLNAIGNTIQLTLTPETYKRFTQQPVAFHLQISAPVRKESYLRIAIHDVPSNRFGVVEIPVSSVSRLAPPVYTKPFAQPATPASTPAKTMPPAAAPH